MRISGIPTHVARAYGAERPNGAARVSKPQTVAQPQPPRQTEPSNALVAASVPGTVSFHGSVPPVSNGSLSLYTRAADRVEAAVGVALGQTIDVRG